MSVRHEIGATNERVREFEFTLQTPELVTDNNVTCFSRSSQNFREKNAQAVH